MKIHYFLILFSMGLVGCSKLQTKFKDPVKIGTASFSGAYYPTGGAMSKIINSHTHEDFSKVISTEGSADNINRLLRGKIHVALVQADRQYEAYFGLGEWNKSGPERKLRSLFSLYPQTINLMATRVSGVKTIKDLKGRRVNLGSRGSGERGNAIDVLAAANLGEEDVIAFDFPVSVATKKFIEGKIDAFFYTIGHPSLVIAEASTVQGGARIVPIVDVDSFLVKYPFYQSTLVPMYRYPSMINSGDRVESIGIQTTVLTTSDIPDAIIYKIVKSIFENLEDFKAQHAVLRDLDRKSMLQGLSAPLHPGAKRYFEESGLLDEFDPIKRVFGD